MKPATKPYHHLLALAAIILCCGSAAAAPDTLVLYVAPSGSDLDAGTQDAPFASLERARDELRLRRWAGTLAGGATVELLPGTHERSRPFELTADDSGPDPDNPTTYIASKGASVRLVGGKIVDNFQPVRDPKILARLDKNARGKVLQADLKALGITDFGPPSVGGLEVFCNDQPMHIARWPNEGFVKIVDVLTVEPFEIRGTKGDKGGRFIYAGDRPLRWTQEKDLWLHGYWWCDNADSRHKVAKLDTKKKVIELAPPHAAYAYRKGQWYYAFNALSELDVPGEWYLDRDRGILYFLPPVPLKSDSVVVSIIQNIVTMKNVSNLALRGMTLEACRETAVIATNVNHVEIIGCTVRNTGLNAIDMEGQHSGCVGCDIYNAGKVGMTISGGCRTTLVGAGMYADNNHIHDVGRISRMGSGGLSVSGVGNRVSHNLIDNTPHTAIWFNGNDNVLELNEIHSACYESKDAGAVYAGRDWTQRGNIIRHNYLHDINGFNGQGCMGIYLDDMFCGTTVQGNLFYNVTYAVFISGGRDNVIDNNLFMNCVPHALHLDNRAQNWAKYHADRWIAEARTQGTVSGIMYNRPPYSDRFPELASILDGNPCAPSGNIISRNIRVGGAWHIAADLLPLVKFADNLLDQDPQFVDPAQMDFRFKAGSPALALGIQQLPSVAQMGLYQDDRRASWPVLTTPRPRPRD